MDTNRLKLESILKTMPINKQQIENILNIYDNRSKEIDDLREIVKEEVYSYGIEKDFRIETSEAIRVGNPDLHRDLPIHNLMRGCLLDDDGNVVEYLPQNDWTTATRDGSKGQVMVHIPAHYRKFYTKDNGNIIGVRISELPLIGYHHVPDMFIGAYEAALDRTNLKLSSVVNTTPDFRGGNDTSDWDNTYRSLLGRPVTTINKTKIQQYARNRGKINWNICTYELRKTLVWLYVIEYANFNSQLKYNAKLNADGYRQGGLGLGANTFIDWQSYNTKLPYVPCGYSDSLGNNSGIVKYTIYNKDGTALSTQEVSRYRGIENVHGHIGEMLEGINIISSASVDNGKTVLNKVYVCDDLNNFSDISVDNYTYIGNIPINTNFIKTLIFGNSGCILPATIGGTSSYPIGDYFVVDITSSEDILRYPIVCNFGSYMNDYAGILFLSLSFRANTSIATYVGSRLCFIPQKNKN